jgi:hypothetical protein
MYLQRPIKPGSLFNTSILTLTDAVVSSLSALRRLRSIEDKAVDEDIDKKKNFLRTATEEIDKTYSLCTGLQALRAYP